ncbi:MAG: hypothetical protein MUO54_15935 [Anaerolineales bacterium]|nr:hypothetical protein [Anaerolineales bacterium]
MAADRTYPVLVLCGRDVKQRELMEVHDPEGRYPSKVLLPMLGKRVIDWQLEALLNSPYVRDIYLIGLSPAEYPTSNQNIKHIPINTTTTILEKLTAGSQYIRDSYPEIPHIIVSTGDAPAITTESIDHFFRELHHHDDADVMITGVPEDLTIEFFPDHGRIVGKFNDISIYPGEMFAIRFESLKTLNNIISQLSTRRLKFNRRSDTTKLGPLMRFLARTPRLWFFILKYLLGILSIQEAEAILSKVFNLKIRTAIIRDPGFGMDMDLPEDYQKLSDYIKLTNKTEV